jgi:hypothetical protein
MRGKLILQARGGATPGDCLALLLKRMFVPLNDNLRCHDR